MKIKLNITPKRQGSRIGPDLTPDTMDQLNSTGITKRLAVSAVNSIYDPLGLLSPLTARYKVLLRELNKCGSLDWDDPVPQELSTHFITELKNLVLTFT